MKYLVISDIHGNYPALKSIYDKELNNVDSVICVGDIVGLMGFPSETVELIINQSKHAVKGNHDISVLEHNKGHVINPELSEFELNINQKYLSKEQKNWIVNLSPLKRIPEEKMLIAHAKPELALASGIEKGNAGVSKGKYVSVASNLNDEKYDFVLLGHTHNQAKVDCSKFGHDICILNPGSVGQNMNRGEADYAIIDTESKSSELCSIEYDVKKVIDKLESLNIPIKWWV